MSKKMRINQKKKIITVKFLFQTKENKETKLPQDVEAKRNPTN